MEDADNPPVQERMPRQDAYLCPAANGQDHPEAFLIRRPHTAFESAVNLPWPAQSEPLQAFENEADEAAGRRSHFMLLPALLASEKP